MNYGVYALRKAFEAGLHDHIVKSASGLHGPLLRPAHAHANEDRAAAEEMLALVPAELQQGGFFEEWEFPTVQLRKRLGGAGISSEAIDTLDLQWSPDRAEHPRVRGPLRRAAPGHRARRRGLREAAGARRGQELTGERPASPRSEELCGSRIATSWSEGLSQASDARP